MHETQNIKNATKIDIKKQAMFSLFVCLSFLACASTGGDSGSVASLSFEQTIEQSAKELSAKFPKRTRVAIAAFTTGNENLSGYIMDELAAVLAESSLEVADRQNMMYVYRELRLQMSGDVSEKSAVSIGKFLGAKYVLTGQLIKAGDSYRYRLASVNVETAIQEGAVRLNVRNDGKTKRLIDDIQKAKNVTVKAGYDDNPITFFADARQPKTKSAGAYVDSGLLCLARGDYDMAIANFSDALNQSPHFATAYNLRANAYASKRNYDKAIADYTQAMKIDPNDDQIYVGRADAYLKKNDRAHAVEDWKKAVELNSNNDEARKMLRQYG